MARSNSFAYEFNIFIVLGTQKFAEYPENVDDFMANMIQPTADAGDVIIFTGVAQHCAMPNKSDKSRTGILIQMLPKVINRFLSKRIQES